MKKQDDGDVVFCAKTGERISSTGNVIPFPRAFTRPVLVFDYAEAVTIKSTVPLSAVDDLARHELAELSTRVEDSDDI